MFVLKVNNKEENQVGKVGAFKRIRKLFHLITPFFERLFIYIHK
jgi:hypothetical protein